MIRKFSFSWKSNVVPLESTLSVLSPKPYIVVVSMNTWRAYTRRLDEDIANVGVSFRGNQHPSLEEITNDDQAPFFSNRDTRAAFLQMVQGITTQAQAATTQAQDMMNQLIGRWYLEETNMFASWLLVRGISQGWIPLLYMVPKWSKTPKSSFDEVYKIHYAVGLTTSEKAELATYQLKDVARTLYVEWRDHRTLRGCPGTWEIFKKAFIDRFFPREKR